MGAGGLGCVVSLAPMGAGGLGCVVSLAPSGPPWTHFGTHLFGLELVACQGLWAWCGGLGVCWAISRGGNHKKWGGSWGVFLPLDAHNIAHSWFGVA